jgi:hypothetical protein
MSRCSASSRSGATHPELDLRRRVSTDPVGLAVLAAYALGRSSSRPDAAPVHRPRRLDVPADRGASGMFELIRALGLYNNLLALTLSYMIFTCRSRSGC